MSILARSTIAPSANSPARIRANNPRLSATGRSRHGDSPPASVSDPRVARIASASCSSTYALPALIRCTAQSWKKSK